MVGRSPFLVTYLAHFACVFQAFRGSLGSTQKEFRRIGGGLPRYVTSNSDRRWEKNAKQGPGISGMTKTLRTISSIAAGLLVSALGVEAQSVASVGTRLDGS